MSLRQRKAFKAIAALLILSTAQVYVQIGFGAPTGTGGVPGLPQQFVARLSTRGNRPITVNGNSAATGATILTGATIETPADVGATINLGSLGTLDLAPNTRVRLDYDQDGNVRVTLVQGCAILHANKKTKGEITTDRGSAGKTDPAAGGILDVCFPPGAQAPVVNQGAAAAAGAGAGATTAGATGGGLFGLGTAGTIAIVAGGTALAIGIPVGFRNRNPSP